MDGGSMPEIGGDSLEMPIPAKQKAARARDQAEEAKQEEQDRRVAILALPLIESGKLLPPSAGNGGGSGGSRAQQESLQFAELERIVRGARPEDEMSVVSALSAIGGGRERAGHDCEWLERLLDAIDGSGVLADVSDRDNPQERLSSQQMEKVLGEARRLDEVLTRHLLLLDMVPRQEATRQLRREETRRVEALCQQVSSMESKANNLLG